MLSTLHTNDAPSTVTRMIDMGIEPFNVASAVNLIVAQRLVRRICTECKQQHEYTAEEMHALRHPPPKRRPVLQGRRLRYLRWYRVQRAGRVFTR